MSNLPDRIAALLEKPSLEGLAFLLDNPAYWPEDFAEDGWDYAMCDACAIGLTCSVWFWDVPRGKMGPREIGEFGSSVFDIPPSIAIWILYGVDCVFDIETEEVLPSQVASVIRDYLANHPPPPRSGGGAVAPGAHPARM